MRIRDSTMATSIWLSILLCAKSVYALEQAYCSSQNTNTSYPPANSDYQSNGRCHDRCMASFAFAIVQGKNCWCSNYAPSSTVSISNCQEPCPGYGDFEQCGNESQGFFGYIVLPNVAPSSSVGLSTSSRTSTSNSRAGTSPTPTPVTSIQVITVSGAPVTYTVTSTPTAVSDNGGDRSSTALSGGAIAGIVIGVLGVLAAVGMGIFLCLRRRANHGENEDASRPTRNTSKLSRTGLLSRGRMPSMGERTHDDPFHSYDAPGNASARHSMLFGGSGGENIVVQPASPLGSSHGGSRHADSNEMPRRQSKPMVYDQRLNPSALYFNSEANGSRVSMQDQNDYSRPLGIANPDPRPSFESRISRG